MAKSSLPNLRQRVPAAAAAKNLNLPQAQARTRQFPWDPNGWKQLGHLLRGEGKLDEARNALKKAADLAPEDHETWIQLGLVEAQANNDSGARGHFEHALTLEANAAGAHQGLADVLYRRADDTAALTHADRVLEQKPHDVAALSRKVQLLTRLNRFSEAAVLCERLIKQDPRNALTHWNDLGNINRDLGHLDKAEACYSKAAAASKTDPVPLSNRLTLLHYMPDRSAEEILEATRQWSSRFAPPQAVQRPTPSDRSPSRKIRLGMFSDGFRQHPVGAMTTPALEHLVKLGVEIYAYTTSTVVDSVTRRLMAVAARWTPIASMSNEDLAQRIRDDRIDILMDLSGHNAGNRIRTMTLQPAPVLVKWVGGLINTTGVEAIDYLLSDAIESPPGSDAFYTEKLIRMPDDYICYMPPKRVPDVAPLPALQNGYVTFGCFNNPTKINPVVLEQWAGLLHVVPDSRLFLKGGAFGSPELHEQTMAILQGHGIAPERVRIEGQSPHYELFQRYNDVDVALDPWPYSGGLTTCEAMLMGVPVVTLPGPTFAGRHSATHLANAGMPELVTQDWDQYRARAQELVSDLQTLSTIRSHLREILVQSPVCDGPRFARNLANALRAVWQRYCAGRAPAALAFNQDGLPWFEDDDAPMVLTHPPVEQEDDGSFNFALQGKVVVLDHGGLLAQSSKFTALSVLGALNTIVIDPANKVQEASRMKADGRVQHYHAHIALGDGSAAMVYACLDGALSGTLEPLPSARQLQILRQAGTVLARLPIGTTRLDAIEGLEKIDWLVLDGTNDNLKILDGAENLLRQVLVLQARIFFAEIFLGQPHLHQLTERLKPMGLQLLRLDNAAYAGFFPQAVPNNAFGGSQLIGADAVFVPDDGRLKNLTEGQRRKLAFIAHSAYGAPDFAYHALQSGDEEAATQYLASDGWLTPSAAPVKRRFVHICYNNMHVQGFIRLLADPALSSDYVHQVLIERSRSIPGYDNDVSGYPQAAFFDKMTELERVVEHCMAPDVLGIFIHGLFFDWQKQLVQRVGERKKVTWILWGGDLYSPIRNGKPMHDVVSRIHAVATGTDGDYELFRDTYGARPRLQFAYPGETDFEAIQVNAKTRTIFVGNSGDPTNMHAEILESLAGKTDIANYEIVLPLSYNLSEAYEQALRTRIEKLGLQDRTRLLTDFMRPDDYFAMLAQAEFLITAHHRQQAMGNLVASLYFGNTTILRRQITVGDAQVSNPGWDLLTQKMNTLPTSFEDFLLCKRLADVQRATGEAYDRQRESISRYYGKTAVTNLLKAQFAAAAEFS